MFSVIPAKPVLSRVEGAGIHEIYDIRNTKIPGSAVLIVLFGEESYYNCKVIWLYIDRR